MICTKLANLEVRHNIKVSSSYNDKLKFYYNKNEHNKTFDNFLSAISRKKYYEAEKYLSKNLRYTLDIKKLDDVFENEKNCNRVVKLDFDNKNKKNSLLIINQNKKNNIVHLHLTYEPDENSAWKIFAITKE